MSTTVSSQFPLVPPHNTHQASQDDARQRARHWITLPSAMTTSLVKLIVAFFYGLIQRIITLLFKPRRLSPGTKIKPYGRIAVVGAGLSGVSSAAHAIAHGFEVVIYEADDRVGGIWARVNATSGLQLNSMLYRFHPAVIWSRGFPHRDEILGEISRVWKEYQLESRTRFKTPVTSVRRANPEEVESRVNPNPYKGGHAKWIVNDGKDGIFDAVIVTVGTCGAAEWVGFPGMPKGLVEKKREQEKEKMPLEQASTVRPHDEDAGAKKEEDDKSNEEEEDGNVYRGPILHSSQLDGAEGKQLKGKTVVVVGSGASGVEAVETALARGADKCIILARDDKWIIPRNMFIDILIAMQPFGRQMPLSFLWEGFLRRWQYHGVEDLVPTRYGLFEGTPVVNDEFLGHVRTGRVDYKRGDTIRFTSRGVLFNYRPDRNSRSGDEGQKVELDADAIVLATGFKKPSIDFLPPDLFPKGYERPNLYLQNFATEDWSILLTNSAYKNAIGTVGHFHIDTRILLTLLMDENARPVPKDMKLWVDLVNFLKRGAKGGALSFFTYMELTIWVILFHVVRPDRLQWLPFIMFGWGIRPQVE